VVSLQKGLSAASPMRPKYVRDIHLTHAEPHGTIRLLDLAQIADG
jgi:hypothetical protein